MRGWRDADHPAVAAWSADADVMRFLGGIQTAEQAWRAMALHAGHWQLRGYGNWVVVRVHDGVVIGRVGLWNPAGWPDPEVGWTLARSAWGAGYATECGAPALTWAFANRPELHRILSVIAPENRVSRRVAERLGMGLLGPHRLLGEIDTVLYGVARPRPTGQGGDTCDGDAGASGGQSRIPWCV